MGRRAAGDDVEARVREGHRLGAADDVRAASPAPDRTSSRVEPASRQPPRDVAAARGDVERRARAHGPRDEQVEVVARAVRVRLDVQRRPLATRRRVMPRAPPRAAPPSSIVASTWRFGGAASVRRRLPSSAFVPSRRTTIGSSIPICSSACRIPRATSSQRVIPPKMLKKIARTCGVARDHLERVDDALRVSPATEVAEVRGTARRRRSRRRRSTSSAPRRSRARRPRRRASRT